MVTFAVQCDFLGGGYELELTFDSPVIVGANITYKGVIKRYGKPVHDDKYEIIWSDSSQENPSNAVVIISWVIFIFFQLILFILSPST